MVFFIIFSLQNKKKTTNEFTILYNFCAHINYYLLNNQNWAEIEIGNAIIYLFILLE